MIGGEVASLDGGGGREGEGGRERNGYKAVLVKTGRLE